MILTQFEENRAWNKKLNKIKVDTFYFFIHILITIVKLNKELINYSIKRIDIYYFSKTDHTFDRIQISLWEVQ